LRGVSKNLCQKIFIWQHVNSNLVHVNNRLNTHAVCPHCTVGPGENLWENHTNDLNLLVWDLILRTACDWSIFTTGPVCREFIIIHRWKAIEATRILYNRFIQ
jgi:hypothetical protein